MLMHTMPEVLTWRAGSDAMVRIYTAYSDLLSERLGNLLGELRTVDPVLGEVLAALMRDASDVAFARVLAAPETSYRLLWKPSTAASRGRFILNGFRAEQAREGAPVRFDVETWTALGDVGFFPDRAPVRQPRLAWDMPLDFGSPRARAVDLGNGDLTTPRGEFTEVEIERVLDLLRRACDAIGQVEPLILDFAVRFNKVLVLQKDPAEPRNFTSGSTGQFIGRSFLTNPHLDVVDEVGVAEGIVHEAIHSLLYMQERQKPWVKTLELYHPTQVLVSPWTGSHLPLRPFMQACFVWYGILQLWSAALLAGAFEPQRARARIQASLTGFLGGPLVDYLVPWRESISDDVVDAIAAIQENVLQAAADVA
jgi:hypothetical protein